MLPEHSAELISVLENLAVAVAKTIKGDVKGVFETLKSAPSEAILAVENGMKTYDSVLSMPKSSTDKMSKSVDDAKKAMAAFAKGTNDSTNKGNSGVIVVEGNHSVNLSNGTDDPFHTSQRRERTPEGQCDPTLGQLMLGR